MSADDSMDAVEGETKRLSKHDQKVVKSIAKELHRYDFAEKSGIDADAEDAAGEESRTDSFKASRMEYQKRARTMWRRLSKNGITMTAEGVTEDA